MVNEAKSHRGPTIQAWFAKRLSAGSIAPVEQWSAQLPEDFSDEYGSPQEIFEERAGMVHRLDKDTSGILVLAKHPGSLINLLYQFKTRQVQKSYLCLVHGKMPASRDLITAPIARSSQDRKKFSVRADGREAQSEYRVLDYWRTLDATSWPELSSHPSYQQGFSLLTVAPKTGRTHQIRVHLAHLAHPLVGDGTYTGRKRAGLDEIWCPRHFLHAHQLELTHPRTHKLESFKAPLSDDLAEVLEKAFGVEPRLSFAYN